MLNTIKCPIVALLRNGPHLADVVPTGTREVEILQDKGYTFEEIPHEVRALLMRKQMVVLLLERVAVHDSAGNLGMVERLRFAFRAARVELYEFYPRGACLNTQPICPRSPNPGPRLPCHNSPQERNKQQQSLNIPLRTA